MRLCLVTPWFPPEQAPIGYMMRELAEVLSSKGWEVTVVTGFPNHPDGVVFDGYRKRWLQEERLGRVRVCRTYHFTSANRSVVSRALSLLSFTASSSWALLSKIQFDIVLAVFQPLSLAIFLPMIARLKRAKLVLNIQDLHPDAAIDLGLIRKPLLIKALRSVEAYGYRAADGLAVICESFKHHCIARGAREDRIAVIENWIDLEEVRPGARDNRFRAQAGCNADDFVVLYAGTIGLVSGAEVVVSAAEAMQGTSRVKFVFVGEGRLIPEVRRIVESKRLANVVFFPFQPRERLAEVQAIADASIVTLLKGKGRTSLPSKVLGYMAAARPVIASVDADSETARLVSRAECGTVVPPGDADALVAAILAMRHDIEGRIKKGAAGRAYLESHVSKPVIIEKYGRFLAALGAR